MAVQGLSRHPINFESEANNKVSSPHSDLLVILAKMNRFVVKQNLIDTGSFENLITLEVFNKLALDKKDLSQVSYPSVGLGDKSVLVLGIMNLTIFLRDKKFKRDIYVEFAVVNIPLSYNAILGRTILNNHGVIIHMKYLCLKLPAIGGIVVVRGN